MNQQCDSVKLLEMAEEAGAIYRIDGTVLINRDICKYEKDLHDIPSSVLVELAKALHTTPNYLLLGDVEADDWRSLVKVIKELT